MFLRILKKDLRRRKTMNVILLLFVALSAMFASASVNNIIAVTGGIDHYFEISDVPDITVNISTFVEEDAREAEEKIRALPSVKEVRTTHGLFVMSSKNFRLHGERLENFINPAVLFSEDEMYTKVYDDDNSPLEGVPKGGFYATSSFLNDLEIKKGDMVELTVGGTEITLEYLGRLKCPIFSNDSTSNPYLLLDREDFDLIGKEEETHFMYIKALSINGADKEEISEAIKDFDGVYLSTSESQKSIYLYDMIAAYIMMVISIVLMVTAFVVLRFTIGFTIAEEFREIGVMKAVGITDRSIRGLYIIKYLAISVIGAAVGFLGSLPLSSMMLRTVSKNMVFENDSSRLMGLVSSAAVVALILLFCYGCTRRVKKLSPIDAVRSGQTGERFGKRSLLHLGRSRLPSTGFMAVNDVLSAPKQFGIMTVIFVLCFLMIGLMSSFSLTLQSDSIYQLFDIPKSHVNILDAVYYADVCKDQTRAAELVEETEKLLSDNGMPASCSMTTINNCLAGSGDKRAKLDLYHITGSIEEELSVDLGSAPERPDEIALTASAFEDLDVEIGDRITLDIDGTEREFIITGRHPTFSSHSAYLSRAFDPGHSTVSGFVGVQILFDGDPDKEQIEKNIEKIKELTDCEQVYTTSEMIKNFTGISDTLDAIKTVITILTVIVTALIAVLMERSFISKEKSEIALMKAVGVGSGSVILQHTLRFVIVSVLACAVSLAVLPPLSNAAMNRICLLIGDVSGIKCVFDPLELLAVCPAIIIGVTTAGAFLTALYTNTVKAGDTASIE
ncbi:MAG: FtsX-like permease family protein [Ruminococcus sp.]|nr:FtsX-like permease family protein [Ruminococcus sp.]